MGARAMFVYASADHGSVHSTSLATGLKNLLVRVTAPLWISVVGIF